MTELVFFLEEHSAKEMLKGVLPRILSNEFTLRYVVFEGKQDLEKRMPIKLRAWQKPDAKFVVMRDQDSGDCQTIKEGLFQKCAGAGKPDCLIRIACHELESFYLGDLAAVGKALGPANLGSKQGKTKYRDPDHLANPAQELKMLAKAYQKISGSRAIGAVLSIEANRSTSFNALIAGVRRIAKIE